MTKAGGSQDITAEWTQMTLIEPGVVEFELRFGWVAESDHCQAQVKITDPSTSRLIGMWSRPAFSSRDLEPELDRMLLEFARVVTGIILPF